jgi:hypothetical protein
MHVLVRVNAYRFRLEGVSKIAFVRDDDGYGLLGIGSCVDADVANEIACFESGFKPLKSDVLSKNA